MALGSGSTAAPARPLCPAAGGDEAPRPGADDFAVALVAACRLTGEDPVAVLTKGGRSKARWLALDAMSAAFPHVFATSLARGLGFPTPEVAAGNLRHQVRRTKWWNDVLADEVLGQLVAGDYAERAA